VDGDDPGARREGEERLALSAHGLPWEGTHDYRILVTVERVRDGEAGGNGSKG